MERKKKVITINLHSEPVVDSYVIEMIHVREHVNSETVAPVSCLNFNSNLFVNSGYIIFFLYVCNCDEREDIFNVIGHIASKGARSLENKFELQNREIKEK